MIPLAPHSPFFLVSAGLVEGVSPLTSLSSTTTSSSFISPLPSSREELWKALKDLTKKGRISHEFECVNCKNEKFAKVSCTNSVGHTFDVSDLTGS